MYPKTILMKQLPVLQQEDTSLWAYSLEMSLLPYTAYADSVLLAIELFRLASCILCHCLG